MYAGLDVKISASAAISHYGDYLKRMYSRSSVSSDGKFPPTPSKTFVNLVVVQRASEIRDLEDVRRNTLHGKVEEMCRGKTKCEIADILKPLKDGSPVSLVFVEGPPGIGKSTLAWELCRRWDRKQYDLAVLLRLRERKIEDIAHFSPHVDQDLSLSVAKDVLRKEGKGVLFVLDGYDELPVDLRCKGLLIQLVKGEVFPSCSVLVTSRPSATKDLFTACRPLIQRHVEILGFTQECVKHYASSIFSSDPKVLEDFLFYISASQNPAINSLMYIPLNAAIVVEIYRHKRRKGCPVPTTVTEVYTQLCLTLIQRHIESTDPQDLTITSFSDLPCGYYSQFRNVSRLAFEHFLDHKIVFNADRTLVHFGFLDSVPALCGGGEVSYNFLHLTLQEFLAAYHISQLSNGIDIFKCHFEDERWEVVWRFVAGLTSFHYFEGSIQCNAFGTRTEDCVIVENLLLHCLFEGQVNINFATAFGCSTVSSAQEFTSPLDRYALGYCIANSSSTTTWDVVVWCGSDESIAWGLNSNPHTSGIIISRLEFVGVDNHYLNAYPQRILSGIQSLGMHSTPGDSNMLVQVIPFMIKLDSLSIPIGVSQMDVELLSKISLSNITNLTLECDDFAVGFLPAFANLVSSKSGKLKDLTIRAPELCDRNIKPLYDILFEPSCLNLLTLDQFVTSEDCFGLLETNTCLTSLYLYIDGCICVPLFQTFSKILQHNKTLQVIHLQFDIDTLGPRVPQFSISKLFDLGKVENFNAVLATNKTLREFSLSIFMSRQEDKSHICKFYSFICDPRVRIKLFHNTIQTSSS